MRPKCHRYGRSRQLRLAHEFAGYYTFTMRTLKELLQIHPHQGIVDWIAVSPGRHAVMTQLEEVEVRLGTGLVGDRHANSGRSKRQVTLVQAEHLDVIAALLGRDVHPQDLRRNIVVRGINLLALRSARFRVGPVLLEGTGPCAPCSRMEDTLGHGGYNVCRGHGGITAIVLEPGVVRLGAGVSWVANL
ncbi:MAG: MOSC domain-containing protein YiiM [Gammaproteobacteria bacterium]